MKKCVKINIRVINKKEFFMNENPGETPNPLNNNPDNMPNDEPLDANPSEPLGDVTEPEEIIESTSVEESETSAEERPVSEGINEPKTDNEPADKPESVSIAVEEFVDEQIAEQSKPSEPEAVEAKAEQVEVTSETPKPVAAPVVNTRVESLDPTGRPMEKPAEVASEVKPRKNKRGLVFMILGCIFLLGAVAAIVAAVMLSQKKSDPVAAAMQKIMSGNSPKNVAIDGDINILINDTSSPIKRINIDLDSDTVVGSMINTSSAVLNITDQSDKDYSVEFEEIYVSDEDLYFKINKATELIEEDHFFDLFAPQSTDSKCIADESGETKCETEATDCIDADGTDCIVEDENVSTAGGYNIINDSMTGVLVNLVEAADGKWIRISSDVLKQSSGIYMNSGSSITCVTDLVNDVNKNSNSAIEIYNKYPFINSTDKNVIIASKQNPIFQISLDSKNFTNYLNAIQNTELARSLNDCMGWGNNAAVTENDVSVVVNNMPDIYAEVDNNDNFTRLYLESDINNGAANVTIDLGFSYPTNVNVSEPVEYTNYEDLIQTLFTGIYDNTSNPVPAN